MAIVVVMFEGKIVEGSLREFVQTRFSALSNCKQFPCDLQKFYVQTPLYNQHIKTLRRILEEEGKYRVAYLYQEPAMREIPELC